MLRAAQSVGTSDITATGRESNGSPSALPAVGDGVTRSRGTIRNIAAGVVRRPTALTALIVLAIIIVACIAAGIITPYQPNQQDLSASLQGPSLAHWLGTDDLGRDTFSRLLYGGHVTLFCAAVVTAVALAVGVAAGLLSGYLGGWTDRSVMLLADIGMSIPVLVIVIVMLSVFRQDFVVAMAALGLLMVPSIVRSVRAPVLALRGELFVDAARISGLSAPRIMLRHILPRVAGPVLVQATLVSTVALQLTVGLACLGFGPQPPNPTWGSVIASGAQVLSSNGWLLLSSGGVVALVTACLDFVGDAIRDTAVQAWTGDVTAGRRRARRAAPDTRGIASAAPATVTVPESESRAATALLEVACHRTPANRSPFLLDSLRHASCWSSASTLRPSRGRSRNFGHVDDESCMHTETSGGAMDTEVNELTAMPTGSPSTRLATAVTPPGKQPNAWRSRCASNSSRSMAIVVVVIVDSW